MRFTITMAIALTLLTFTVAIAGDLEEGEKEVTTTREAGYNLGVIYDKMTVTERVIVSEPPRPQILPREADLFKVIEARYDLLEARGELKATDSPVGSPVN